MAIHTSLNVCLVARREWNTERSGYGVLNHRKSAGYVKQPSVERIDEILNSDFAEYAEIRIFASEFVNWFVGKYGCSLASAYRMMNRLESEYDYSFIRWFYG